ncbi:complement component C8 alpha chain isoform X2 [Syngnathoides biaculeatus]|uniref:complement component C8 alpha chain isoform X2 n=1 Tax=Syngnathoides biaculeatus TaxID=300417 RepID=UPI002ADE8929|nr:complement component C8 alpha chain isoform X2 [Syngnathoides biaculeatus]
MGSIIHFLLCLCTLHLWVNFGTDVNAHRGQWPPARNRTSGAAVRRLRAVSRPIPIDCKVGSWSSWTECNSCTDQKFRFRYLEKASQFGGAPCLETLWETLACPTTTAECLVPDYCGESFTCKESGRCIGQSLRCNGEADCDDFSDEEGCEEYKRRSDKCATILAIPGAERGTQGYNALTGEFVNHVLDPKYFGGKCEYVYNGEWRKFTYDSFCENLHHNEDEKHYRKPHNYHTYRFVAEATSEGTQEYYSDAVSLLNARKTMSSFNAGVTVGVYYVQVGLSGSEESEFLKNISRHKSQDLGFVRIWSKVETAHFKMRSNGLMLHEDFYLSLMELPEQYDFGMYSRFFDAFGTHYVTEGAMGGTLEYVLVVNKTSMAESKLEWKQAGSCFGGSVGLSAPIGSYVKAELAVGGQLCKKGGPLSHASSSGSSAIKDVLTLVKGGYTDTSGGLVVIRDPDAYRKWGASLKYNPTVVEQEIMPIHELVRLSTAFDQVGARLANLQRALEEYQQQFSACRCAPCRHNGVPVLAGTSCSCVCKPGYRGQACEDTLRTGTGTDGSWSCWGVWSACTSGTKRRTRTCDNPPPDGGGATCLGSSSQSQRC